MSDNFGMLAIGVNNAAGIGDTSIDPNDYGDIIMQMEHIQDQILGLHLLLEMEILIHQMD